MTSWMIFLRRRSPIVPAFLLTLLICGVTFAQSGRRITPKPSATPAQSSTDDPADYSESKELAPRRTRPQLGIPRMGQDAKPEPSVVKENGETAGDDVLKVETNLITIPVSVFDRNGLYISGLGQQDFKIFEDGKQQEIAYFGTSDKPFTVILMIDTSPSTAYKIEEIHRAAIDFVDQLKPQDSVMVIEFNEGVKVRTEPTNDRNAIYKAIKKANFGNGTSLYDAVDFAIRKRINKIEGRKAIVLFTDGVDTTSRRSTYDRTVDDAEESDSLFFPIYYNTFFDMNGMGGGGFPNINSGQIGGILNQAGTSPEDYRRGRQYLNDLAAYTGGRVFRPESTPGGLSAAFEGIAEELRRQYSIGYVPADEGRPGQRKEIKVRVARPNVVVRARDSYIVGSIKSPSGTSNTK
jgi:VWFA-related protein